MVCGFVVLGVGVGFGGAVLELVGVGVLLVAVDVVVVFLLIFVVVDTVLLVVVVVGGEIELGGRARLVVQRRDGQRDDLDRSCWYSEDISRQRRKRFLVEEAGSSEQWSASPWSRMS